MTVDGVGNTDLDALLDLANQLADAARPITLKYFRSGLEIIAKDDNSPVTIADRESERVMRDLINAAFPDHGIVGEEHGTEQLDAEFVWVLDPIDGTQSFVTGKPLFGILIALMRAGQPVLGVMDMPALNERWVGAQGRATTFKGEPVQTRACRSLEDAWLYSTSANMFTPDNFPAFERLRLSSRNRTVYGAECQAYGLLACGWVDLVCEDTMGPYDYLPLVNIVEGAGGVMTDWQGASLGLDSGASVIAAGNPDLHAAALAVLRG
jgi:inositol-phosphate phosphatase/L-galactose 1-phosphate phosphatase/histidinol-phosphatase